MAKDYSNVYKIDDIPKIHQKVLAAIEMFCAENKVDSLRSEVQNVFNACLIYIRQKVFPIRDLLLDPAMLPNGAMMSNNNKYNYDLLMAIIDYIYMPLCFTNDKECSIFGFGLLTGIDFLTIRIWLSGDNLSPQAFNVAKRLHDLQEETLQAMLRHTKNPVGVVAILNHKFGWNGISQGDTVRPAVLSASALPRLGGEFVRQIENKGEEQASDSTN